MRTFEKTYALLFGRSAKKISAAATLALVVFALLNAWRYPPAPLWYAAFGAVAFALMFAVDRTLVNPRRSYYVAVVSTLLVAFFDFLFGKPPLSFALVGAATVAVVAQSLKCRSFLFVLPFAAVSVLYYAAGLTVLSVVSLLYAAVVYGLRPLIRRMADGLDAMCMFSSFLYATFSEDDVIEDAFRQLAKVEKVPLHLYRVGDSVVVVSDFHPGPFRHIGGGMLVDVLTREVERLGYRLVFLHGVGSHERDPVTKQTLNRIVDAVKQALEYSKNGEPPRGIMPRQVVVGDVKVTGLSLGAPPYLAVVGRVASASDDIPLWVADRVDPGLFLLVDAQNKFDGEVRWRDEDVVSLAEVLKQLHESAVCKSFQVGIGKADASRLDPLGLEIGPGGVSAIVSVCDGVRSLLVVFDGNNLHAGLYRAIVEEYTKRGYAVVEVATTDTHRATGVGLGRGYRIVGERLDHGAVLGLVDAAVRDAERRLGPHGVSYLRVVVEAEVLGAKGFRKIQHAVSMYKRVGLLVASVIFLLPIVLTALLT
ncbi:MAG: DUF2070 family protein [Pyrobaculum sp.]